MKQYKQLSYEQRCHIFILKRSKLSQRKIASMIGVNQSTVSREIKRNSGGKGYQQNQAQLFYEARQKAAYKWVKLTHPLRAHIRRKLRKCWSPEQIAGWLKSETRYSNLVTVTIWSISYVDLRDCRAALSLPRERSGCIGYAPRVGALRR